MNTLSYLPFEEVQRIVRLTHVEPAERAELFAAACRLNALYMIKRAGSGHIGSSFSCMDIVTCLFLDFLKADQDQANLDSRGIYFSSKGHDVPGLYSVLLGLGLLDFEKLHGLRRLNGLPGHPDIAVPHMHLNTGSLGMGISKARGIARADKHFGRNRPIYVLTGDGELQEGQIWESLQPTANAGIDNITMIVDHNKIQSDTWVSSTSDLGDLERKFAAFGWHVGRCNGNDYKQVRSNLEQFARVRGKPKVLIADTFKGHGVSRMTSAGMANGRTLFKFHSGAPANDDYQAAIDELQGQLDEGLAALGQGAVRLEKVQVPAPVAPPAHAQRLVGAYSLALVKQAEKNPNIVALDGDLVKDVGLLPFEEKFPDRFFECGIAEQDMVSQAGAMARFGLVPFVHSFACFLSTRPNEQIYNNVTEESRVVYVGSLAGLLPAGPGHSHQCVRDIASLGGNPHFVMFEPSCEREVELAVEFAAEGTKDSVYLRMVSIPCETPYSLPESYRLQEGRGVALTEGDDVVLFAYGPVMLSQAVIAAQTLARRNVGVKVVNLPWLNRVDEAWLRKTIGNCRHVLTIDNHYLEGGQGQMVAAAVARCGFEQHCVVSSLGITQVPLCGTNDEVLRAHGLNAASLVEHIDSLTGIEAWGGAAQSIKQTRLAESDAA